jgi:PIN domain nuclease of toxin-antitoxin system
MRLLLDTHYLIWALDDPARLPKAIVPMLEDPSNDVLFSAASIWEIAIKHSLGRADFDKQPGRISDAACRTGFTPLPVTISDAAAVASLPPHHRDPFDRLLVAQALAQPARLLTADPMLASYSELVWLQPA